MTIVPLRGALCPSNTTAAASGQHHEVKLRLPAPPANHMVPASRPLFCTPPPPHPQRLCSPLAPVAPQGRIIIPLAQVLLEAQEQLQQGHQNQWTRKAIRAPMAAQPRWAGKSADVPE